MATNSKQNTTNKDEVDLLQLFIRLGELIKNGVLGLINLIGSILLFLLQKWYYLFVALILTLVTAYSINRVLEPVYTTELVIKSNATTNQPLMTSVNKLGEYASEGNSDILSKELNLSKEEASSIKGIESFWYYDLGEDGIYDGIDLDGKFISDTSVLKVDDEFLIRLRITNPGLIEKVEQGLVNYLEENPLFKALNEQRLLGLEASIIQTQYEIEKLDSLQKKEYYADASKLKQQEGQIVITAEKEVQTFHDDMFRLLRIKQRYETDLRVYRSVITVINSFPVPSKADNGITGYAKKMIWYYMGLAVLIAVLIKFRKKIWIH